ncbi:MAG: universal stress protein [Pirellulales bacterium]|nr:universal stress protein [Pirellulales bacterium]
MKRFRNILVGVDLADGDRLVGDTLSAPSVQAVEQALWLARTSGAKVTLMYSLDVCARTQQMILENGGRDNIHALARGVLEDLVHSALDQGVDATSRVEFGPPCTELIQAVRDGQFDLVVIGTKQHWVVSQLLFGTTGLKLLRKCPCPVWVVKPNERREVTELLVAHDLSPVGELALELGASMSELYGAKLHVLHAVEPEVAAADESFAFTHSPGEGRTAVVRSRIVEELGDLHCAETTALTVVESDPAEAIVRYVNDHDVELLVLGSNARSGISGLISGNLAEQLLPGIRCSVMVVKSADLPAQLQDCD